MDRPSLYETRIYVAAFLLIGVLTLGECCYGYGRVAESMRQDQEQNEIVDQAIAERDAAQARYDSLARGCRRRRNFGSRYQFPADAGERAMTDFLKLIALVTCSLAVTFGLFLELCKWCVVYDVTPWLSIPGTMVICGCIYFHLIRETSKRLP